MGSGNMFDRGRYKDPHKKKQMETQNRLKGWRIMGRLRCREYGFLLTATKNQQLKNEMSSYFMGRQDQVYPPEYNSHVFMSSYNSENIIEYPLTAIKLDEPECNHIEKPITKLVLLLASISLSTPKEIVHGKKDFQREGVHTMFDTKILRHIRVVLDITKRKNITSALLWTYTEQHLIETGCGGDIFAQPDKTLDVCTSLTRIWEYLLYSSWQCNQP